MPEPDWPRPGQEAAQKLEVLKARLAWRAERAKAQAARTQAEVQAELDLHGEFHKALIEAARSAIDRSQAAAETVQKAAAAILALYTAVLGLSFSVADNPLPSRGVLPAIFLGTAVVFSTAYLAFLTKPSSVKAPKPQSSPPEAAMARTRTFIEWAGGPVSRRAYWLQASVVALGVALMFIPAPFVTGLPYVDRLPWNDDKKATAPKTPTERPAWPTPPATGSANIELLKIRYRAEVAEASKDREKFKPPAEPSYANQGWWLAALVGLALVFLVPALMSSRADLSGWLPGLPKVGN